MTSTHGDDASTNPAPTPAPAEPEEAHAPHDPMLEAELASIRAVGENRTSGT